MKAISRLMTAIVFLISVSISFGQTYGISDETGLITYEEVLTVDSMKAHDIYNKVKEWAILTFKNSEKVIVGDNKPTLVKANYITQYFNGVVNTDFYTSMTIKIKDEAVKVVIDGMTQTSGSSLEAFLYKKDGTLRKGKGYTRAYNETEITCREFTKSLADFLIKDDYW